MPLRVPLLFLTVAIACTGEHSNVGDAGTGPEPACFGCPCADDLPCAEGLECTHNVCSIIEEETGGEEVPPSACGWNPAMSWYDCGFQGEDPKGEFPLACPDVAEPFEPYTACPASLPFEGCCDEKGNVWYCDEDVVINTKC